jgi:glycosyltransferase involved in cell wall biosynthesis
LKLYIVRDGSFTINGGRPSSNLLHYETFGKRYTKTFKEVVIIGRLFNVEDATALPLEGDGVTFKSLPGKRGVLGALSSLLTTFLCAWKTIKPGNAYLLRVPGTIPIIFYIVLKIKRVPFAVEVAADPHDSYSSASLNGHKFALLVQKFFVFFTSAQCLDAVTSLYVTKNALQKRYPPSKNSKSFGCTSIDLPKSMFRKEARSFLLSKENPVKLILVGNMESKMKGHDVLFDAIHYLKNDGYNITLNVIGYGKYRGFFEGYLNDLNLKEEVCFSGKLSSGVEIFKCMEKADIFILPSRQEGLPRALIEAMSQGMPAIATRVGGTHELIDSQCIVEPESPKELAHKIIELIETKGLCDELSMQNLEKASEYSSENVSQIRNRFLSHLKSCSVEL